MKLQFRSMISGESTTAGLLAKNFRLNAVITVKQRQIDFNPLCIHLHFLFDINCNSNKRCAGNYNILSIDDHVYNSINSPLKKPRISFAFN